MKYIIYKYPMFDMSDTLRLPVDAQIVHFGLQHERPTVWAQVRRDGPAEPFREFVIVGTGHPFPKDYTHRGTVLDGEFVWHLMELPR